jgi:hypothetical protein
MESFGKTVLAIVIAGVILWLGYHLFIEVPAARQARDREFRTYMDGVHRQQDALNRWSEGGPGWKDAKADFYREKAHEEPRQDRQKP